MILESLIKILIHDEPWSKKQRTLGQKDLDK